jgi:hypothetical protein
MKKMVLLVGVAVVFGCGRFSLPSDSFVKECMLGGYYSNMKVVLAQESATQQASQILPDSADYIKKNLDRVQIVSITKTEKGKCQAEVKFLPLKTGNELFDRDQDYYSKNVTSYKLTFIFDERHHKWLFDWRDMAFN